LKIDEIVTTIALKPDQVVADLGAGTGLFEVPLGKAVAPAGKVYAVEIDKGFLPIIEEKAKQGKLANVRTVLGEFADPKLPAQDVDIEFMHDVLHHVEDRATYLKNATHVVLVHSEIHWNSGNAGRTCLATGAVLHSNRRPSWTSFRE